MNNFLLIAILIFPLSLFAETIVFNKTFGGSGQDFAYFVQQTTDGGYIIAGQTDSFGNGSALAPDIWIIKTDKQGDMEWDKTFGKSDRGDGAFCVRQTTDAGYIVAGTTSSFGKGYPAMWLLKLNPNGDSLWTKIYEGRIASIAYSIQQTPDEGYIVTGKGVENVLKLDQNGNIEWGKKYNWIFYTGTATADSGYIVAGDSIYRQLEWNYIPCRSLYKLDRRGNEVWHNPWGNAAAGRINSIQQTRDGGYIVAGDSIALKSTDEHSSYAQVAKLDPNGNTEWTYYGNEYSGAQSIRQTADGGYIAAGNTTDEGHGLDFLIVKLDENGKEEWIKRYGSRSGWEYASSIQQTADAGYIVAGQTDALGSGRYDVWLLKLDGNGNCPDVVDIVEARTKYPAGFLLSHNFPNPFNPATTIAFHLPETADISLKIFDIKGELVKSLFTGKQHAGDHVIQWDGRDEKGSLAAGGLYFYQLRANRFIQSKKMVLIR